MDPTLRISLAFAFGVVFVIVLLLIAVKCPTPTHFQYNVFRVVLSLAAGGIGAMIPGFLDVKLENVSDFTVMAGGAMAVFVIVYFLNPARLAVQNTTP